MTTQKETTKQPAAPSPIKKVTNKRTKDPKKIAAGRASPPLVKKHLLEQIQAAKESLRAEESVGEKHPEKSGLKPP